MSMNYQPVVARNQPNHNACIKENLNADDDVVDAAFDVKENDNDVHVSPSGSDKTNNKKHDNKVKRDDKGKSHVGTPTGARDLRAEFEEFSFNNTNRVNALSAPVNGARPNLTNNTNSFNTTSPFDTFVSPNFRIARKSSFMDPSKYPDDPDMPGLSLNKEYDQDEPKKVHQALKDPSWIESIQEELLQFKLQKEEGIDYDEVFAPVARIEAIRLFLAYASFMDFMVYQMDVKSVFLYETIEEEVYVCQPPGFEDPDYPDKVYKVVKAIYGLHQDLRAWYETLSNYLLENSFQRGKIDQTLFIKKQKGDILLVQVYVDDIIFGLSNKELCKAFKKLMKDKFQMSSMGELTLFLGLQVKKKDNGIFISQDKYIAKILKKFGFTDVKSASTPIETEKPLLKDPDGEDVDVHIYMLMIGSLMYLTLSRPDIMFAVCACLRFQVTPKVSQLHAVKRIFRYLKGKPHLGLWYTKDSPFNMVAYSDSDYARASLDKKSTIRGCQFLGKKVVVTEDVIRSDLHLNDADGVECLLNEEIFTELARIGYEKPPTKLTFYKVLFFTQWKFLIHTLVQCVCAKRTAWNEFSCSMASVVICLATVDDLTSHNTKYTSPTLTQKVFANMRRVGKGFLRVETPLFNSMLVQPQPHAKEEEDEIPIASSPLPQDPTPAPHATPPALPPQEQPTTTFDSSIDSQIEEKGKEVRKEKENKVFRVQKAEKEGNIEAIDVDEDITLVDVETQEEVAAMDAEPQGRITQEEVNATSKGVSVAEPTAFDDEEPEISKEKDDLERAQVLQKQYDDKEENIDWNAVAEQIQERHLDNIKKYQSLKKKPVSIAQARKNMIIYLKNMAREDLVALWNLVIEKFSAAVPSVDKEKVLWVERKRLFEPDADDVLWKLQRDKDPFKSKDPQKFLIHTLVQCLSAKRTAWNEFSYSMASAVICLATVVMDNPVDDMTSHNTRYTSPALTQKVFANMQRVGKGFSCVETPLFASMLVPPQPQVAEEVEIPVAPAPLSTTTEEESQEGRKEKEVKVFMVQKAKKCWGKIEAIDTDEGITLVDEEKDKEVVAMDAETHERLHQEDVSAAEPIVFDDEEVTMTMAQTLIKLKAEKAKFLDE
nr:putative ribonuclease H-like domain-containing protein [Tanacetum cinerariifolium]